jgi:DNA-directed RNA polymerase specialized sigma24 family protein
MQKEVHAALAAMPADLTEVLHLRVFQDKSERDMARDLHLPKTTVRRRIQKAMKVLEETIIEARTHDEEDA